MVIPHLYHFLSVAVLVQVLGVAPPWASIFKMASNNPAGFDSFWAQPRVYVPPAVAKDTRPGPVFPWRAGPRTAPRPREPMKVTVVHAAKLAGAPGPSGLSDKPQYVSAPAMPPTREPRTPAMRPADDAELAEEQEKVFMAVAGTESLWMHWVASQPVVFKFCFVYVSTQLGTFSFRNIPSPT